jgi:hypothetical protein
VEKQSMSPKKAVHRARHRDVEHACTHVNEVAIGMFGIRGREDHHRPLPALESVHTTDRHACALLGIDAN